MVVFDANVTLMLLKPDAPHPVDRARDRIDFLIKALDERREKIIIPAPTLAELLVWAGAASEEYLRILNNSARFKIEPFDQIAAIDLANMTRSAIDKGDKRGETPGSTWAKVNFDRQIIAIAKSNGATAIYSEDEDIRRHARAANIPVITVAELPLPPAEQEQLFPEGNNDEIIHAETIPAPTDFSGSGDGNPAGRAGTKTSETAEGDE